MKLEKIELTRIPCFKEETIELPIAQSNFIYGPNGSGKSSIARELQKVEPVEPGASVSVELFDQQYIDNFISPDAEIEGVFTVRAGSTEVQEALIRLEGDEVNEGEIALTQRKVRSLEISFSKKEYEIEEATKELIYKLWKSKRNLPDALQRHAFKGFLNNKEKFSNETISRFNRLSLEDDQNDPEAEKLLLEKLDRLNNTNTSRKVALLADLPAVPEIPKVTEELLAKPLSEDSSNRLSSLIKELKNTEWVREGIDYLGHSGGVCPFCQQGVDENLEAEIRKLFDREYESAKGAVNSLRNSLNTYLETLDDYVRSVKGVEVADISSFEKISLQARAEVEENLRLLAEKSADMSKAVKIEFPQSVKILEQERQRINEQIQEYNRDIENTKGALLTLKEDIWLYFLGKKEVSSACIRYSGRVEGPNKAIENLGDKIEEAKKQLNHLRYEYENCKSRLTSAVDVKNEINQNLRSLGFTSFHLALIDNGSKYRIERDDGSCASRLSEGEKTLISFLYFFQRISDRIADRSSDTKFWVVLDDPISSLDSQSLSAISHLCRDFACKSEEQTNYLDKLFVLTHNAYFYQEVIYEGPRKKVPDPKRRLFSFIRKAEDGTSQINTSPENQIESTYELLWRDIREAESKKVVSAGVQNSMRRILEVYFRLIGGPDGDLIDKLGVDLQLAAKSLLSWVNDGSHQIRWDLDSAQTNLDSSVHFRVFRDIFDATGQINHYNMMMGINVNDAGS
ncbi:AAA family ATPase [Corynebacterium sp. TAE3-ERU30]|uniref:AAA family ATPase n=1 Tax=Corynebacterium sp. TAE3-ERU30 TaxID=2849496 RepID=UPI001C44E00E|nr:AAA family ATPase [Corynebacterium sp. TAE3-ERU30]MBV7281448.1 AAA family ATPase [Corynebacterium sp. TAE3-ERU30]